MHHLGIKALMIDPEVGARDAGATTRGTFIIGSGAGDMAPGVDD